MNRRTKVCYRCKVEKPVADFNKRSSAKDGLASWCRECNKQNLKKWASENYAQKKELSKKDYQRRSETYKANARRWREENPERKKENDKRWREENPERKKENDRRHYEENIEKKKEYDRLWRKYYLPTTKHRQAERQSARRARLLQATPEWSDRAKIIDIFEQCRVLSERTGIPHHVDHIIPLAGKNVCGLHIPENLQILTASENFSKNNKFDSETDE